MFTQDLKLTSIQQNYFSNYSFLAKDIKKIITLLSKRELSINLIIDKIKHSRLLFICESVFKDKQQENISIEEINELYNSISNYLITYIENKYFIEEIFKTLWLKSFCNDVISTKNNYLKRIKTCIKQLNKIIKENKIKFTKETQIEDLINNIYNDISLDLSYLDIYLSIIRKQYSYVWYPKFFEEFYFHTKIKEDKLYKEKKIDEIFDRLFELLENLVISYNVVRLHYDDGKESYFIQKEEKESFLYPEGYYLSTEISKSYHGGMDMSGSVSSLNKMLLNNMKEKYGNCLSKITWDTRETNNITIYFNDILYGMYLDNDCIMFVRADDKEDGCVSLEFNEKYSLIDCEYRLKGKTGTIDFLKGFFIYCQENDYLEYKYEGIENKFIKIKFKINEIVIETEVKKEKFTYDIFFNIEKGRYSIR